MYFVKLAWAFFGFIVFGLTKYACCELLSRGAQFLKKNEDSKNSNG